MSSAPQTPAPNRSALRTTLINWLQILGQIVALALVWCAADRVATVFKLPISGGVLGLLVLVALLLTGAIKPPAIQKGAELLLANMLLYFIPLVVSVVQYVSLIETEGLKLFAAIGPGFMSVLLVTAFTVEWVCLMTRKRQLRRHRQQRSGRQISPSLPRSQGAL